MVGPLSESKISGSGLFLLEFKMAKYKLKRKDEIINGRQDSGSCDFRRGNIVIHFSCYKRKEERQ